LSVVFFDVHRLPYSVLLDSEKHMSSSVTHFAIYAEDPASLAIFYRRLLGWQVEKAPGIDYWRIDTAPGEAKGIGGGLMFRPIPEPRSWVHYLQRPIARANCRADH
jgi:predicted enzyme related to lactoylglutathione lyase